MSKPPPRRPQVFDGDDPHVRPSEAADTRMRRNQARRVPRRKTPLRNRHLATQPVPPPPRHLNNARGSVS